MLDRGPGIKTPYSSMLWFLFLVVLHASAFTWWGRHNRDEGLEAYHASLERWAATKTARASCKDTETKGVVVCVVDNDWLHDVARRWNDETHYEARPDKETL